MSRTARRERLAQQLAVGDGALVAFKVLTIAVTALIPVAWAAMHRALFAPRTPVWIVTAAAYLTFVAVERHLGFLTAFAGKNAVLFALLLFPGVMVATVRLGATRWAWILAAAPLTGLFLIHYSMAHLSVAFLAAYVVFGRSWSWRQAVRMGAAGALAAVVLLDMSGAALADPRAAAGAWAPGAGLAALWRTTIAARPELVVFHDGAFGLVAAYFRVAVAAACVALAVAIGVRLRDATLWRPAATYGVALGISLLFGYGVLPARITVDFMRCYAWTLQAMVFLVAGLALLEAWRRLEGRQRQIAAVAAGLFAVAGLGVAARDMQVERKVFARRTLERVAVQQIADALPKAGACALAAHGRGGPDALVTEQHVMAWNYAEAVSPCRFLTGSWVQPGVPGGRDLDGLPAAAALPRDGPVFLVGSKAAAVAYASALARQGRRITWRLVGHDVGGAGLWRAQPMP